MSNKVQNWAWMVRGITHTDKLVLVRLADHANDDGLCYPGKSSIAQSCCMAKRTCDSAINRLEAVGLISIVREKGATGRNLSNVYQLSIGTKLHIEPAVAAPMQELHPGSKQPVTVQHSRGDPATAAPELSLNHQEPIRKDDTKRTAPETRRPGVPWFQTVAGIQTHGQVFYAMSPRDFDDWRAFLAALIEAMTKDRQKVPPALEHRHAALSVDL